jgi:hypothetical protein
MRDQSKLKASSRLALAAYLHDLGKFAERARIKDAHEKNADGNTRAEIDKQLYTKTRRQAAASGDEATSGLALSEAALAIDWMRDEEDEAWAHLQPGK